MNVHESRDSASSVTTDAVLLLKPLFGRLAFQVDLISPEAEL